MIFKLFTALPLASFIHFSGNKAIIHTSNCTLMTILTDNYKIQFVNKSTCKPVIVSFSLQGKNEPIQMQFLLGGSGDSFII